MKKKAGHTHTALENTKRLLHILYGENYILEIQEKKIMEQRYASFFR